MIGTPPAMAPMQGLTPQQLAAVAAAAFHPPNLPQSPGMQIPGMAHAGFGIPEGMAAGMGMGMGMNVARQSPEANVSGFPAGGGPQGPSGGALAPDPSGGGFWDWISRQVKGLF